MKKLLFVLIVFLIFLFAPVCQANVVTPIRILLVPGHDNEVWGARYGNLKEADMNLAVATRIYNILKQDKKFSVYITRDSKGYVKEFTDYFSLNREAILAFKENAKKETENRIQSGNFIEKENVLHNAVTQDVSVILYGINKWANENKIDVVIHIHFNDYPRPSKWTIGQYKGFAIYIPDGQLDNWKESGQLAEDVFTQLHKKYTTSIYKPEAGGLVSDQKLIAIGANNTLNVSVRSILIEYGYIYEKKFRTSSPRLAAYKDMANLTVTGIKNYFFPTSP